MNKLILILGIILLAGGAVFFLQKQKNPSLTGTSIVPLPTKTEEVQLIDPKSIVEKFLQNIADKKIPEAIAMMTAVERGDEATKQAWGVYFNAFKKLIITSVEPSLSDEWTEGRHVYKVIINVEMSPESKTAAIPYYGYGNGTNIRWIAVEKENGTWKIGGITTGP